MTAMLASVRSAEEARIALAASVDIIDLKEPDAGALGAVAPEVAVEVVGMVTGKAITSATVGDLQGDPQAIVDAVDTMSRTGVDIVKVGLFENVDRAAVVARLAPMTRAGRRLVAVLFADREPVLDLKDLIAAEWYGVMLDTAGKASGSLPQLMPEDVLKRFVNDARTGGMHCGFAGSLGADAVPALLRLHPDYLGFRGTLCDGNDRRQALSAEKVTAVRALIPADPRATRLRHKTAFRSTRTVGRY